MCEGLRISRSRKTLIGIASALALAGAVLAFALQNLDAGPLSMSALGGVLLASGVILAGGVAIASIRPPAGSRNAHCPGRDGSEAVAALSTENLRAITGLVVVVTGIIMVGILTIVTVSLLGVGNANKDATVAITTSAFGIVSTVVTAFLGIKATANASQKAVAAALQKSNDPDPPEEKPLKPDPASGGGAT